MSMAIGSKVRTLAADGYFGKQDLQKAAENLLDGKGATKPELERLLTAVENLPKGTRTTDATMKAAKSIVRAAARNPQIDRERIKSIIKSFPEPRSSSGGESGGSVRPRVSSGGESGGGSVIRRTTAPRGVRGGE